MGANSTATHDTAGGHNQDKISTIMPDNLQCDIFDDGSTYRITLPPRELGEARKLGWLALAPSAFGLAFMVAWISTPLSWGFDMLQQGQQFGWALVAFASLGLIGLRYVILGLVGGVAILRDKTRSTIEIRRRYVVCREKLWFVNWRRKVKIDDVQKLSIGPSFGSEASSMPGWLQAAATADFLVADRAEKGFPLTGFYPREVLMFVADQLAEKLDQQLEISDGMAPDEATAEELATLSTGQARRVLVEIRDEVADDSKPIPKPANSSIVKHELNESTVFEVPPKGIRKGSAGLFGFSILWMGFMVVFTSLSVASMIQNGFKAADFGFIAFIVIFWGIGFGLLTAAINMGRRSTMIAIVGDSISIKTKSIFGEKKQSFAASELNRIVCGPSGMEVNDVPVDELQIHPSEGKKSGHLSQCSTNELEWLAYEITQLLDLQPSPGAENWRGFVDETNSLRIPSSSGIEITETAAGRTIAIPTGSAKGWLTLWIVSTIFVVVGTVICLSVLANGGELFQLIFGVAFGGMGLAGVTAGRVIATRRFDIELTRTNLTVERFGLLSRKTFSWPLNAVTRVDRHPSSTSVNNQPLDELLIKVTEGPNLAFMTGRPDEDIDLVAAAINQFRGIGSENSEQGIQPHSDA